MFATHFCWSTGACNVTFSTAPFTIDSYVLTCTSHQQIGLNFIQCPLTTSSAFRTAHGAELPMSSSSCGWKVKRPCVCHWESWTLVLRNILFSLLFSPFPTFLVAKPPNCQGRASSHKRHYCYLAMSRFKKSFMQDLFYLSISPNPRF